MPNFTPKLNLIKPLGTENFSVGHANSNADKIDNGFGEIYKEINQLKNVSPFDFGAIGDGLTDDTQAFIQMAESLSNDSEVSIKGKFYIKNQINFRNDVKIKFDGGQIVTDSSFSGDSVFYVSSTGDGNGHLLNANFLSKDDSSNATALILQGIKNFVIDNFSTKGYLKGGLLQLSGYELFTNNLNIIAPRIPTRNFSDELQFGVKISSSDGEHCKWAVVGYPVGVDVSTTNNFINIHSWGIPSNGNSNDYHITLYPFLIRGTYNNFVNCYADTPDVLNPNLAIGENNGGIGFYEATQNHLQSYPSDNSYVNCKVTVHPASTQNKMVGFQIGDVSYNAGASNDVIISPKFVGSFSQKVRILNETRVEKTLTLVDASSQTQLSYQKNIKTNELMIQTNQGATGGFNVNNEYITKKFKILDLKNTGVKIFDVAEVTYFSIRDIVVLSPSVGVSNSIPNRVMMTSDGINSEISTITNPHLTENSRYQIGYVKWYGNAAGSKIYVYKESGSYYLTCDEDLNIKVCAEIFVKYS